MSGERERSTAKPCLYWSAIVGFGIPFGPDHQIRVRCPEDPIQEIDGEVVDVEVDHPVALGELEPASHGRAIIRDRQRFDIDRRPHRELARLLRRTVDRTVLDNQDLPLGVQGPELIDERWDCLW